jgi:antitoxin VapB
MVDKFFLSCFVVLALLLYMPKVDRPGKTSSSQRTAKVFMNNRSQAVRLPKQFQFKTKEVLIRREGNDIILSPRPRDWSAYLANGPAASMNFMEGVEDLPLQERAP